VPENTLPQRFSGIFLPATDAGHTEKSQHQSLFNSLHAQGDLKMEQRGNKRYKLNIEVDLQFSPQHGFMAAHTRDLSIDGAFIETGHTDTPPQHRIVRARIWLQDQFLSKAEILTGIIVRYGHEGFALRFGHSEGIRKFLATVVPGRAMPHATATPGLLAVERNILRPMIPQ
jgi:hypothetical protein